VRSGESLSKTFFFSFSLFYPSLSLFTRGAFSGCCVVVAPVFRGSRCLIDLVQPLEETTEGNQKIVLVQVVAAEDRHEGRR